MNVNELSPSDSYEIIKQSHLLNGDSRKLAEYYRGWVKSYNRDVRNQQYRGPDVIGDLFVMLSYRYFEHQGDNTCILDAGCGTGLTGLAMARRGIFTIDGFDLSHEMIAEADKTGVYRSLLGGVDMNRRLDGIEDNQYDATICCGVFTLGHVYPESMDELLRVTKPGGLILVSTRRSYLQTSGFDEYARELVLRRQTDILYCLKNAPYLAEESAWYWAFRGL